MKARLERIVILAKTIAFFLLHGKADKLPLQPKKVVVVQMAKLGDMICTTPVFRALKKAYPGISVTVVGDRINAEVLTYNQDVDSYIVWENDPILMAAQLRKEGFDFACTTGPHFAGLAALYLAGIPAIAVPQVVGGWSPYETRPYKILRSFVIAKPHAMGSYAPREYLRLLEPVGVYSEDTKKYLSFSPEALEKTRSFIAEKRLKPDSLLVGISPAAGNKIKQWPPEKFAEVADHLVKKYGATVCIMGGPRDVSETDAMKAAMREVWTDAASGFSIDELKALVSQLSIFIAGDTGPIYIAETFGVPTVDIVGPVNEKEQPPIGRIHKVVVPERERPELFVMNARDYNREEALRQARSTPVTQVIAVVEGLLADISHE